MLRSAVTALGLLMAAAGSLRAQTGEVGVSLTILEPLAFAAPPRASAVRHRPRESVEVSMPLEFAGRGGRIVSVSSTAGERDTPGFRVRGVGGDFEPLAGGPGVALGRSGKVGPAAPAEALYRLDLHGKPAPGEVRLTVTYLIAPDA